MKRALAASALLFTASVSAAVEGGSAPRDVFPALVIPAATSRALLPDRRLIAGFTKDYRVVVWDAMTGSQMFSVKGGRGFVSPRSDVVILGPEVWSLAGAGRLFTVFAGRKEPEASGFSKDGARLAVVNGEAEVWDLKARRLSARFATPGGRPSFLAFSDDDAFLAVGRDHRMEIYSIATGELSKVEVLAAVWPYEETHGHGFYTVVGKRGETFRVSSRADIIDSSSSGSILGAAEWQRDWLAGLASQTRPFAVSPRSREAARAVGDRVDIEVVDGREVKATLRGHSGKVTRVAFSPDRWTLASADENGEVRTWDELSGELLTVCRGLSGSVHSLAYSPDAQFLLAASSTSIAVFPVAP
ncbi:MAG: hypothetical protein HY079_04985 [Elusimicrobia bacterium]|nr:hypothetical protein [Elusimicrobiota bacterium]